MDHIKVPIILKKVQSVNANSSNYHKAFNNYLKKNNTKTSSLLTSFGGYDDALARQVTGSTLDLIVIVELSTSIGAASSAR